MNGLQLNKDQRTAFRATPSVPGPYTPVGRSFDSGANKGSLSTH